jgi:hypothetical protein
VLGPVEVLEPVRAEIANADVVGEIVLDQLAGGVGDKHLAAVARRPDAGGAVDADADVTLSPHLRLPGVETRAHVHLSVFGPRVSSQAALGVDGCCCGVGRGPERNEERIALRVHHLPLMGGEGGAQNSLLLGQCLFVAVAAKLLEQARRALNVREEEGDGAGRKSL